jgi:hypothetical protein
MVKILSKETLRQDVQRAGFEGIEAPDVGAAAEVGFFVATRPR